MQQYSIDNFVCLGNTPVQLKALEAQEVVYLADTGVYDICKASEIQPLPLTPETLQQAGFKLSESKQELLHINLMMIISVNGRNERIHGVAYKNKYLWVYKGFNVLYFHTLQNLMKINYPQFDLRVW